MKFSVHMISGSSALCTFAVVRGLRSIDMVQRVNDVLIKL